MSIVYRNTGDAVHSFPLNPSFPSGGQAQDLNILGIVAGDVTSKRPDTPAGWTLVTSPYGDNWNTAKDIWANLIYYLYVKVGAYTGPLGNITWSGSGNMPPFGIAAIDIFGCGATETWDYSLYSTGSFYMQHPKWQYSATGTKFGASNRGRIDPGPNDMVFMATLLNAENSGYPITEWLSSGNIISSTGTYSAGAGVKGTYTNVDNDWTSSPPGSGNMGEGVTMIRGYFQVTTVKPPFGAPTYSTPLYNPSNGTTVNLRLTLNQKSSSDARTIVDKTTMFGLTAQDTSTSNESSRDNGPLNANQNFDTGVSSWTAQNGATIAQSFAQFKNGDSSMLITPDGATSTPQVISEELTIIPNSVYKAHAWMRGNGQAIAAGIFWYNSSHSLLSTSMTNMGGSSNGVWKEYLVHAKAPPGAVYARIAINGPGVLSGSQFWYADEVYIADGSARTTSIVPYPRRWSNGDIPNATSLNKDWRDTFNWLLGNRPCFIGSSSDTTNWTVGTWYPIPINTEYFKQYFIHSANDTKIYVPEDGWYEAVLTTTRDSTAAGTTAKDITSIRVNGSGGVIMGSHEPHLVDTDKVNTGDPVSIYLSAGDYIELAVWSNASAGTVKNWSGSFDQLPVIEIWWAEK